MMNKRYRLLAALLAAMLLLPAAVFGESGRKVVYLTFDDGPKETTPALIEQLEALDVPATFFFVGAKVRTYPQEARLVYEKGYPIGCHTVFHDYGAVKGGADHVRTDFRVFRGIMHEAIDPDFETDLYRFPGGNTSYPGGARRCVRELGCAWFDWNAMTGDTLPGQTAQDAFDLVVKEAGDAEVVIILAHEGKKCTMEALPQIVAHFRERGFEFRALSTDDEDREILSRCPAPMGLPAKPDVKQ